MRNLTDFVGVRFTASIGEPWDFVSSAGPNKLDGKILAIVAGDSGQPRILCSVSPFNVGESVVNRVVGVNRYISSQNLIESLVNGRGATMNFAFTNSGHDLNETNVEEIISNNLFSSFLIGTMELEHHP